MTKASAIMLPRINDEADDTRTEDFRLPCPRGDTSGGSAAARSCESSGRLGDGFGAFIYGKSQADITE